MDDITVKVIEGYAETLEADPRIKPLPQIEPGAAGRIAQEVRKPLVMPPDLLERHLATVKAFFILNTPPYVTYVQRDDHKAMEDLASAASEVLEQIPEGFRKPAMHILLLADHEMKRRHVVLTRSTQRQIDETQRLIDAPEPNLDAIRQKQDEIQKALEQLKRFQHFGPIDILDRVQRIRSDLEYVQELVSIYRDKKENWKDDPLPPPQTLADLGRGGSASPWAPIFEDVTDPTIIIRQLVVGDWLPGLFRYHFAERFGMGRDKPTGQADGPGTRFLIACLREVGIVKGDGSPYSVSTLYADVQLAKKWRKASSLYWAQGDNLH
jgi:hypothetical protein